MPEVKAFYVPLSTTPSSAAVEVIDQRSRKEVTELSVTLTEFVDDISIYKGYTRLS